MGIYIFSHEKSSWFKVGHHKGNNPYMRLLGGGFNSNKCPEEIRGKCYHTDVKLLKWYPGLEISVEKQIHKCFKCSSDHGEWYHIKVLEKIVDKLDSYGNDLQISDLLHNDFLEENSKIIDNHGKKWTRDEETRLIRFLNNNVPVDNISMFMGRTVNAINCRLEMLSRDPK